MKTKDAYHLSRIQAEGWNAARAYQSNDPGDFDEAAIDALCPYPGDPEKARWVTGFRSAFKARPASAAKKHAANDPLRKTLHLRVV